MSLLGISPLWWALGLAGLAATLFVLHLLRVRLRRQTVDSLLFFRQVGAVRKPRVLLGVPARWLSYLLGLLLLAALWTAFAQPRATADGPSRAVLVDLTTGSAWTDETGQPTQAQLAERATELASAGLGPNGRVVAFGDGIRTLWRDGEPLQRIGERAAAMPPSGSQTGLWSTLGVAARELARGDEIVLLGGPAEVPSEIDGIPIRRAPRSEADTGPGVVWVRRATGAVPALEVEATTGGGAARVRARRGDVVLATAAITATADATARATLGPLPIDAVAVTVDVTAGGVTSRSVEASLGAFRPIRVFATVNVPDVVRLAIAADPRTIESGPGDADVCVATVGAEFPGDRPTLLIDAGVGSAPRRPHRTDDCPLPLGLRDRALSAAAALAPGRESEAWVEDAATGEPLVAVETIDSVTRIRTVDWLLESAAHRDVPALIAGSLHWLAGSTRLETSGTVAPAVGGGAAPELELDARPGAFPWSLALLALGLIALATDTWLHHRGRAA